MILGRLHARVSNANALSSMEKTRGQMQWIRQVTLYFVLFPHFLKLKTDLLIHLACKRPHISLIALFNGLGQITSIFKKVNHGKTEHNTSKSFFVLFRCLMNSVIFSTKYFHTHGLWSALTFFSHMELLSYLFKYLLTLSSSLLSSSSSLLTPKRNSS